MTQVELMRLLGIGQPRVSAIERADIETLILANIRSYVEALGGSVRLMAHTRGTEVTLSMPKATA